MENTTYGASSDGLEELYRQIHVDCIESAQSTMKSGIEPVITAIDDCWRGPDEKKFVENLKDFIKAVDKAMDLYDENIENEFKSVFNQWIEFQSNHVS